VALSISIQVGGQQESAGGLAKVVHVWLNLSVGTKILTLYRLLGDGEDFWGKTKLADGPIFLTKMYLCAAF